MGSKLRKSMMMMTERTTELNDSGASAKHY